MATRKIKFYALGRKVTEKDKVAPQAGCILSCLPEDKSTIARDQLIERVTDKIGETRQPPSRIFSFYRPHLVSMGVMKESVKEVEVEKPAKDGEAASAPAKSVKGKKGKKVAAEAA